jgi:hypothetical protein
MLSETSGSHSDQYEHGYLWGCYAIWSGRNLTDMSDVLTAYIVGAVHETARHNIPKDSHLDYVNKGPCQLLLLWFNSSFAVWPWILAKILGVHTPISL